MRGITSKRHIPAHAGTKWHKVAQGGTKRAAQGGTKWHKVAQGGSWWPKAARLGGAGSPLEERPAIGRLPGAAPARLPLKGDCLRAASAEPAPTRPPRAPHHGPGLGRIPTLRDYCGTRFPTSPCPPPPKGRRGDASRRRLFSLSAPGGGEGRGEVGDSFGPCAIRRRERDATGYDSIRSDSALERHADGAAEEGGQAGAFARDRREAVEEVRLDGVFFRDVGDRDEILAL